MKLREGRLRWQRGDVGKGQPIATLIDIVLKCYDTPCMLQRLLSRGYHCKLRKAPLSFYNNSLCPLPLLMVYCF